MTQTRLFTADILPEAVTLLKRGGVLIVPTDTVYGLVCHPDFPEALDRIRRMKARDVAKPFQLLAATVEAVQRTGALNTPTALHYATYWPGALTLVLATANGQTEGFRVPNNPLLSELIASCGGYLRATSVNFSGEPPATALECVPEEIKAAVDLMLDGGALMHGQASAVIRVTPEGEVQVLRKGRLTTKA
jgi:L-threonylcarbamoyladenylate synthase